VYCIYDTSESRRHPSFVSTKTETPPVAEETRYPQIRVFCSIQDAYFIRRLNDYQPNNEILLTLVVTVLPMDSHLLLCFQKVLLQLLTTPVTLTRPLYTDNTRKDRQGDLSCFFRKSSIRNVFYAK
jgi:hypothetical protein